MGKSQTHQDDTDGGILVAPHEVRELIVRLTEQSVEGIRFDEPRTLAGLSIQTGVSVDQLRKTLRKIQSRDRRRPIWLAISAVLVVIAVRVLWARSPTTHVSVRATKQEPIQSDQPLLQPTRREGLAPVAQVTYGPEAGDFLVDPTFSPLHMLPEGLGISLEIHEILWGAGNPRSGTLHGPLSASVEKGLREDLLSLLQYARRRAGSFGENPGATSVFNPALHAEGPAFPASLEEQDYGGQAVTALSIPPPGKESDAEAARIFSKAVDDLVDQLQNRLRMIERTGSQSGPQ